MLYLDCDHHTSFALTMFYASKDVLTIPYLPYSLQYYVLCHALHILHTQYIAYC